MAIEKFKLFPRVFIAIIIVIFALFKFFKEFNFPYIGKLGSYLKKPEMRVKATASCPRPQEVLKNIKTRVWKDKTGVSWYISSWDDIKKPIRQVHNLFRVDLLRNNTITCWYELNEMTENRRTIMVNSQVEANDQINEIGQTWRKCASDAQCAAICLGGVPEACAFEINTPVHKP